MSQELQAFTSLQKKKSTFSDDFLSKLHHKIVVFIQGTLLSCVCIVWLKQYGDPITCGIPFSSVSQSEVNTKCLSRLKSMSDVNEPNHFR